MKSKIRIILLCFVILSGCSSTQKSIKYRSYINNAFEVYRDLSGKLDKLNNDAGQNSAIQLVSRIDSLCCKEIKDSSRYDFASLIEEIEKTKITGNVFPSAAGKMNNVNLEVIINEFIFRTLIAVQYNLEIICRHFPAGQKLSNEIISASTNSGISEAKTIRN